MLKPLKLDGCARAEDHQPRDRMWEAAWYGSPKGEDCRPR